MTTTTLSARVAAALGSLAKSFRATPVVNGVELECLAGGSNDIRELMADAKRLLERAGMSAFSCGCSLFVE